MQLSRGARDSTTTRPNPAAAARPWLTHVKLVLLVLVSCNIYNIIYNASKREKWQEPPMESVLANGTAVSPPAAHIIERKERHYVINMTELFGPPSLTKGKGLIIVPGHGNDLKRREILRNNTGYINFDKFDCLVFVYADPDATESYDLSGCKVFHKKGNWVDFMWAVAPDMVKDSGYTSVTVMLDDVLIAPPNLLVNVHDENIFERMYHLLETHGLGSVSPNVIGSDHKLMSQGLGQLNTSTDPPKIVVLPHPNGFVDTKFNEAQLVMFPMAEHGWPCFHSLLDPEVNPMGWGYDWCFRQFCNASQGLMDAAVIHFGRWSPYGFLGTTQNRTTTTVGDLQMHQWAENYRMSHSNLKDWPASGKDIIKCCRHCVTRGQQPIASSVRPRLNHESDYSDYLNTSIVIGVDMFGAVNVWNENAHHLVQYASGEVMGRSLVEEFIIDDFKEAYLSVTSQALHGEEITNVEFLLKRKDGAMIKILTNATAKRDEQGNPTGVLCIGNDITGLDNQHK